MMRAPILPVMKNLARHGGAVIHWGVLFALLLALLLQVGTAFGQTRPGLNTEAPPTVDRVPPPPPEGEEPYDDAQFMNTSMPSTIEAGSTRTVTIMMRNTGSTVWSAAAPYPYRIGSRTPENNVVWGVGRVNVSGSHPYGANVTFTLNIKAPSVPGTYSFDWQMLREDLHWFGNVMSRTITVTAPVPVYDAQFISSTVPTTMTAGSAYNVAMTFKNTGNVTWNRSELYRIGTSNPVDNVTFGTARVDMGVASVAPGQSGTFNFQIKAPAAAGSYVFDWGMLWEQHWRFGQTSAIRVTVNAAATKPAISVQHAPAPVAGSTFTTYWTATNATSLSRVCTAAGTGYKVNETVPVNGSRSQVAQAAWVGYPSTCTWTASGAGGSTTYTETLTTSAGTTAKPVINVTRTPAPVAGQSFTTAWTTSNATSLTRMCTASGTGYKVNESLAVNGSRNDTALAEWVGYPSSCTWTANGAGGTTTHVETVTTTAAASGGVTYIHTDGLGSPVARTDAAGQVISRTRYEPYGYVASGAAPSIGFTGHVNDADTGLTYMQQRYYDPAVGRFLSVDPIVTEVNTGNSFNRYTYANNNPYKYVDPDGRFSERTCADMVGNCTNIGGGNPVEQRTADRKVGIGIGAAAGAAIGVGLSGACDVASSGVCIPANPAIVAAGATIGGAAGGVLIPPVLLSSRELAKNIATVFELAKGEGQAAHHIVAENDRRAAASRQILSGVGMDINSAFNGMIMSERHHQRLHTNLYHISVGSALYGSTSYTEVAARLTAIRAQIYMGIFPR